MKLVIDIPDSIYETIEEDQFISRYQLAVLQSHIRKGVSLPKGHGRLIDVDELLKCAFVRNDDEGDVFVSQYYCIEKCDLDNLPTIIKADKAESEE